MPNEEKAPFYSSVIVDPLGTVEEGYITDKDTAHELAITEATMGRDAALRQEEDLLRVHETGISEIEARNEEIMDKMIEKYPNAFKVRILEDGSRVAILCPPRELLADSSSEISQLRQSVLGPRRMLILSRDGIISLYPKGYDKEIDSPDLIPDKDLSTALLESRRDIKRSQNGNGADPFAKERSEDGWYSFQMPFDTMTFYLACNPDGLAGFPPNQAGVENLKKLFQLTNAENAQRAQAIKEVEARKRSVADIVDRF